LAPILYGVSPIGFGHASRSVAIGLKLREKSLEPEFATGGPAAKFLNSYGFKVHDVVTEPVPAESGGEMKMAALWYLRYWLGYRSTSRRMAELVTRLSPRLVVGDEEFTSVSLAVERGIPHAMISDELQLGFARGALARRVESRVSEWYADLQRRVSNLLVPSFGKDSGNIHYMTPVTREVTQTREAARAEHGLPLDSSLILFSSSGSGIGRFVMRRSLEAFRKVCSHSEVFATTGVGDQRERDGRVRELGVVRDNQNLIAAADLVISTAGKSTIDECVSSGTPMIAIPIRNHAEQERNAAELGFSSGDLDRLEELIPKLLGKRTAPARYAGAQRTADYLESLLSPR
jgi:UDP-N-acetylglucosamine--N-acetylmuramyl-(pentapeptide) pyrophosphoryl-undecaprenol N-acetylglucosamine transferase